VSKTQQKSIKSIDIALNELVDNLGIKQKLKELNAVVYWDSIVGKQISCMTTATHIVKGVLFVNVKTSTWRNELTLRKKEIINKINSYTGNETVKDIKFR
jgi:predicted nucleic acid-binding Zn ribbon protein